MTEARNSGYRQCITHTTEASQVSRDSTTKTINERTKNRNLDVTALAVANPDLKLVVVDRCGAGLHYKIEQ
jgi:hypothetical protein